MIDKPKLYEYENGKLYKLISISPCGGLMVYEECDDKWKYILNRY